MITVLYFARLREALGAGGAWQNRRVAIPARILGIDPGLNGYAALLSGDDPPVFYPAPILLAAIALVKLVSPGPAIFRQEKLKNDVRLPAARKYIAEHKLNELFAGDAAGVGLVVQGGLYNAVLRALELLGLADAFGHERRRAVGGHRDGGGRWHGCGAR